MNIAFIHNYFPAGGAEKVTIDILKYLSQFEDYNCYVYCMHPMEEMMDDSLRSIVQVKQISKTRNVFVKAYKAYRLMKKDNIDIVVEVATQFRDIKKLKKHLDIKTVLANHGNTFWHQDPIAGRLARKPKMYKEESERLGITDIQALAYELAKEKFMDWYNNSDAYVVLCQEYKEEFEKAQGIKPSESHVHVIENAQEAVADVNYDKEKMILFCGRLAEEKRVDHLLEIWKKVQDRLPDYSLVILGSDTLDDKLKQMAEDLELERVEFKGHVNNTSYYYQKASVLCLVSSREGWPLSLTEAQAHGCIALSYDCTAGVSDILAPTADGICGFTVKSGDKDAFAEELLRITALPEEEKLQIRHNAVKKRLAYLPEHQDKKWKDLFDKLYAQ